MSLCASRPAYYRKVLILLKPLDLNSLNSWWAVKQMWGGNLHFEFSFWSTFEEGSCTVHRVVSRIPAKHAIDVVIPSPSLRYDPRRGHSFQSAVYLSLFSSRALPSFPPPWNLTRFARDFSNFRQVCLRESAHIHGNKFIDPNCQITYRFVLWISTQDISRILASSTSRHRRKKCLKAVGALFCHCNQAFLLIETSMGWQNTTADRV